MDNQSSTKITSGKIFPAILKDFLFYVSAAFLSALSVKWLFAGFQFLLFSDQPGEPRDLLAHWTEQQHVNHSINPYILESPALDLPQWLIGAAHFPWMRSFITGGLLYSPGWPLVRYYNALVQLLAIIAIIWCVWGILKGINWKAKVILSLSITACSTIFTNLWVGQLAVILSSTLLLALRFYGNGFIVPGLLIGFSLIKPTLTAYFLPAVLIYGGLNVTLVATAYVAVATVDVLVRTQTSLLKWMSLVMESGEQLSDSGYSLLNYLMPTLNFLGFSEKSSLVIVFLLVSAISIALMFLYRRSSLMLLFAIAAVAGRLATYHRAYDNFIIIFLLIPLGYLAFKHSEKIFWLGFTLIVLSLWGPVKLNANEVYNAFQILAWIIGLVILLASHQKLANTFEREKIGSITSK